jgi:hypothetical protein
MLRGTSLESAVKAKHSVLASEWDFVQDKSSDIPAWNTRMWEPSRVVFGDWILLDAWYRSRCLELPISGESMVPYLDMVNHSSEPNAYFEQDSKDDVTLLLRPDKVLSIGDEVTISYGESKSAAEMLFSYGFVDTASAKESMKLPLQPFPDDPLAKAKLFVFEEPPQIHIWRNDEASIEWKAPFAYLMCINEEDGLDFRVLQDTEGGREVRLFWMDEDVTGRAHDFETLIEKHELFAVLKLRVVTVVQDYLIGQLQTIQAVDDIDWIRATESHAKAALELRNIEARILEGMVEDLEEQVSCSARVVDFPPLHLVGLNWDGILKALRTKRKLG